MPAVIAIIPTIPFEKAPVILSNIGRTAKTTASLRLPFFNCPYSIESVSDKTTTSCAKVKLNKISPIVTIIIFVFPNIKNRYDRIIAICPILNNTFLVINLFRTGYNGAVENPITVAIAPAIQNSFGFPSTNLKK